MATFSRSPAQLLSLLNISRYSSNIFVSNSSVQPCLAGRRLYLKKYFKMIPMSLSSHRTFLILSKISLQSSRWSLKGINSLITKARKMKLSSPITSVGLKSTPRYANPLFQSDSTQDFDY